MATENKVFSGTDEEFAALLMTLGRLEHDRPNIHFILDQGKGEDFTNIWETKDLGFFGLPAHLVSSGPRL